MKEFLLALLEWLEIACWVEVKTDSPRCAYYFGPFLSKYEAKIALEGYVEDLQAEGARGIQFEIKRCQPAYLTIFDEKEVIKPFSAVTALQSEAF